MTDPTRKLVISPVDVPPGAVEGPGTPVDHAREQDERRAWDAYAVGAMAIAAEEQTRNNFSDDVAGWASEVADALLEERRKRWGHAQ